MLFHVESETVRHDEATSNSLQITLINVHKTSETDGHYLVFLPFVKPSK